MRRRTAAGLLVGLAIAAIGAAGDDGFATIFDGKTPAGWVTNHDGKPLAAGNVQADGINPHGSGGYVVMYEKPVRDFVLDFEYKLSKGCNSGVFLRIGDPKDPVYTGLEIALDDTTGTGLHDSGAIYDLAPAAENAQKPAGEWNRMRITAIGRDVSIRLNGKPVTAIDLARFVEPGTRPDGSKHKFEKVAIRDLIQKGYLGFQDHGQDCWFRDVKLKVLD